MPKAIDLVPARLVHVGPLAHRLREIDRIEVAAMGRTPKEALRFGLRTSHSAFTALEDGKPLAMMGVASTSLISGRGCVWLVGTDRLFRHGRALLTLGPGVLAQWHDTFATFGNVVSTGNHRAIRLLLRWGAHVGGEIESYGGVDFVPFSFDRSAIQGKPRPA